MLYKCKSFFIHFLLLSALVSDVKYFAPAASAEYMFRSPDTCRSLPLTGPGCHISPAEAGSGLPRLNIRRSFDTAGTDGPFNPFPAGTGMEIERDFDELEIYTDCFRPESVDILLPLRDDFLMQRNSSLIRTDNTPVSANEGLIRILDSADHRLLFSALCTRDIVYVNTERLNVRRVPTTDRRRWNFLAGGTRVTRIGISECGWDLLQIGDDIFFVWGEYLTHEPPVNIIDIGYLEEESAPEYNGISADSGGADTGLFSESGLQPEVSDAGTPGLSADPAPEQGSETVPPPAQPSMTYLGQYNLTAYMWTGNPCFDGSWPEVGVTVACNTIPMHSWIFIEGYGTYQVRDTGNMGGDIVDIYLGDYASCIQFGMKYGVNVYLIDQ